MALKSYKVFTADTGELLMVIVLFDSFSLTELNRLFKNGMNVTVVDERSKLVNKNYVDKHH